MGNTFSTKNMRGIMKKTTYLIILLTMVFSCGNDRGTISVKDSPNAIQPVYIESKDFNQSIGLDYPQGIAAYQNLLVAADMQNNRVIVMDNEGNIIREITSTENAVLSLPTGITIVDERIYVISSGNHKVHIYTINGEVIRSIDLLDTSESPDLISLKDIVVKDNIIYISTLSDLFDFARIFAIDGDSIKEIGKELNGYFLNHSNDVVFLSTFEVHRDGQFSNMLEGGSGKHYISQVQDGKINKKLSLPHGYVPFDACEFEGDYYIIRAGQVSIEKLDLQNKSLEIVYESGLSSPTDTQYITVDSNGSLYISNAESNSIQKLIAIND
jgi:hypothetical protein